jgi:hypothetical protein
MVNSLINLVQGLHYAPKKIGPSGIKGIAGFTQGQLMSLLSMGKSNFIGYNRDSQWTTQPRR